MKSNFKIGVLASTNGTDLQAIIDEMKEGKMPGIELAVVVSNKKNSFALERAATQGYKTIFVDPKSKSREEFDRELIKVLNANNVDLVCLIGYMKILSPIFIESFRHRIINVHPALIPKFAGAGFFGSNVHESVLAAGESETGCTIHFVDENVDEGEIIIQKKVAVLTTDTAETLKQKVQELEKKWYPEVIRTLAKKATEEEKIDRY